MYEKVASGQMKPDDLLSTTGYRPLVPPLKRLRLTPAYSCVTVADNLHSVRISLLPCLSLFRFLAKSNLTCG